MFCKNCGKSLNPGEMFCENCGTRVENQVNSNINQNITNNQPIGNNQYQQSNNTFVQSNQNLNTNQSNTSSTTKDGKLTASLILGIISVVLSFVLNFLILPVAIVGLILGLISKQKGGKKVFSIILNVLGIIIPIAIIIFSAFTLVFIGNKLTDEIEDMYSESTYYGDGYTLEYDYNWSLENTSDGQEVLKYSLENTYFMPIGKSAFSEYYTCDFNTTSCQEEIYEDFFELWEAEINKESLYLYRESNLFDYLNDDAYYAVYNYGKSSDNLNGKFYLLVSQEKNIVLSFMTNTTSDNIETLDYAVKSLLEDIEIEDNSNIVYDDELYNELDSMRDWNIYSELRSGDLGKAININGGWRILGDSEEYWEFKDGEFWWYKSVNDLNDNYWYGTTKIEKGKAGLKLAGLDENKVDTIISNSNGKITDNDIYTIVCTPTKIISGGVDKSETNIPEDTTWTYVWILVDHEDEGIEGQVLDMETYDTSYYVKIKD